MRLHKRTLHRLKRKPDLMRCGWTVGVGVDIRQCMDPKLTYNAALGIASWAWFDLGPLALRGPKVCPMPNPDGPGFVIVHRWRYARALAPSLHRVWRYETAE